MASALMFVVSAGADASAEDSLKRFLQGYFGGRFEDRTTRYAAAFVDLNGDGVKEVIVHVTGRAWCGSGGCNTYVLAPKGSSYAVVTRMTVTRPPIRVLTTRSHGWLDLAVFVAGGGILPGYEAVLRFDGSTYPTNPTMPPAQPLARAVSGRVVVPLAEEGKALYP